MLNVESLTQTIEEQIKLSVDSSVQVHVTNIIQQLALDSKWISKIETLVNQNYIQKFSDKLHTLDVDDLVVKHLDSAIDRWQDRLKQDFKTHGIADYATSRQLTVMDDAVVVEKGIGSRSLLVEQDATINGSLVVQN